MTNKEAVIEVLKSHSCLNGGEIKFFAKRLFNVDISPQSAAGVARTLYSQGMLCRQRHPVSGKMIYWLTEKGKAEL